MSQSPRIIVGGYITNPAMDAEVMEGILSLYFIVENEKADAGGKSDEEEIEMFYDNWKIYLRTHSRPAMYLIISV